jgi:hypothetical protein
MLLSGPSKAGKSYLLLQLVIAIAEGREWLGWPCAQGRVLYVNLELDRASCLHRLKHLYEALGLTPENVANVDLWNLRGNAVPMDVLAPKLIRRARKFSYKAIVIDPIYKVLTGSENEADDMAKFCNHFDRVCTELGAAVIYCHHHSKGVQGQKASRDRSSGSGVFARDPDAILDIIELTISEALRKQLTNRSVCDSLGRALDAGAPDWRDDVSQDDALIAEKLVCAAPKYLDVVTVDQLVTAARECALNQSGWRLEGTLREFPPIDARRFWFQHPIHLPDADGLLVDAKAAGEEAPWQAERREKNQAYKAKKESTRERLLRGWNDLSLDDEPPKLGDLADCIGVDEREIRMWLKGTRELVLDADGVVRTRQDARRRELESAIDGCRDLCGCADLAAVAKALKRSARHVRNQVDEHGQYDIRGGKIVKKEAAV